MLLHRIASIWTTLIYYKWLSLRQNVGEIEQQIILPNAVRRILFAWRTKFGEINPRGLGDSRPGFNFTNLLMKSANVQAVIILRHLVSPTKLLPTLPVNITRKYEKNYTLRSTLDMHNIRPAGQMWTAKALNLVRQPVNL